MLNGNLLNGHSTNLNGASHSINNLNMSNNMNASTNMSELHPFSNNNKSKEYHHQRPQVNCHRQVIIIQ